MGRIEELRKKGISLNMIENDIVLSLPTKKYQQYLELSDSCKGKIPFSCLVWLEQGQKTIEEIEKYAKEYRDNIEER